MLKFSTVEKAILDDKCGELEAARFITEIAGTNNYSTMPVLAAKKDVITNQWTAARMCQD